MSIPIEFLVVLLSISLAVQGWILITLIGVLGRMTRIETALELQGLLDHKKRK